MGRVGDPRLHGDVVDDLNQPLNEVGSVRYERETINRWMKVRGLSVRNPASALGGGADGPLARAEGAIPPTPLGLKCGSLRLPQPKPVEPFPKMPPSPRARVGNEGEPQGWVSGPGLPFEPISLLSPEDLATGGPHDVESMYVRCCSVRCTCVRALTCVRTYVRTHVRTYVRMQWGGWSGDTYVRT